MTEPMREIRLAEDLCGAAEKQFGSRFGSIEELLTFVLKELTRDDAARMDENEARIIQQRLRDLGYV